MIEQDAFDVAQEIRMERQTHKGAFFIVEGRNDQSTLYRHVDEISCSIVIAGTKDVAMEALQLLDEDGFAGVICLVDSDFEKPNYESENLVITGAHDMDVVVFCSAALDRYLFARADHDKVKAFEERMGKTIRDILFESAAPIGCLRALSKNIGLRLRFSDLNYDFVSEDDLSVDENTMFDRLVPQNRHYDRQDVRKRYEIVKRQNHPRPILCQGHDLMTILGIALRRCIADVRNARLDRPDARTWRSEVEMGCRLAFGRDEFEGTELFVALVEWQQANEAYTVLLDRPRRDG